MAREAAVATATARIRFGMPSRPGRPVEPVGHDQRDRPGGDDGRGVEHDQDAPQRLRSPPERPPGPGPAPTSRQSASQRPARAVASVAWRMPPSHLRSWSSFPRHDGPPDIRTGQEACRAMLSSLGRRRAHVRWPGRLARHATYGLRRVVEPQLGRLEYPVMNERLRQRFMTQFGRQGGSTGIAVALTSENRAANPPLLRARSRSVVTFRGPPLHARVPHDDLSDLCFQC